MTRAVVLVAAALLGGPVAAEPARRIVAVLDVHVGEGLPAELATQFQRDLEKAVDTKRYWLAAQPRVHELMTNSTRWAEGCTLGPCMKEVRTQTGADVALVAALSGSSSTSYGSVITLVRTDTGQVIAQDSARCDVCTIREALASAERATVRLLEALPPTLPDAAAPERAAADAASQPLQAKLDAIARHDHRVIVGTSLLVAGLAATVAGIAIYGAENHSRFGLATAGAGGGLAASGVVVLTF